jgi:hypothetical protein
MNQYDWYAMSEQDRQRIIAQQQNAYYNQQANMYSLQMNGMLGQDRQNIFNRTTPQGKLQNAIKIADEIRKRNKNMQVKRIA